jgi:uncharacterized lipoprotein NlpE involved in copper resistance
MNTAHVLGSSALVAALTLTLVGCNQASEGAERVTTVEKERVTTSEVDNTAAWIRERVSSAGAGDQAPDVDDDMALRRLHLELERIGR